MPIALGLIVTQFQIIVDGRWASETGASSVSWMRYATTLIQMPLGLVPVAISLAALPSLAQRAAAEDWEAFRSLFARGLRMLIVLLMPATVGLFVLATPIINLLFQHGSFTVADTAMTTSALRLYLIGLPFAGVDFLLNYTFYARQDTRTPAIVGVFAVGLYFVAAWTLKARMGFLGLVLADSIKQAGHATIMTALLMGTVGRPSGQGIMVTAARAIGASLLMGIVVAALAYALATASALRVDRGVGACPDPHGGRRGALSALAASHRRPRGERAHRHGHGDACRAIPPADLLIAGLRL